MPPIVARADEIAASSTTPLAATPPMGFNNWARFTCVPQAPPGGGDARHYSFQTFMTDQGRAMTASGLAKAGYRTLVTDDCWMERRPDGNLHGASHWTSPRHHGGEQPGFDDDLTAYVATLHRMGLLAGLYNTSGYLTCEYVPSGEAGHQTQDARKFARWGVDFLKLDNCGAPETSLPGLFRAMGDALGAATAGSARKILFDESAPAEFAPSDPLKYESMSWVRGLGQMWRTGPDVATTRIGDNGRPLDDPWLVTDPARAGLDGVYQSFTDTVALSRYVSPGNWNDADQLLIGDDGLTSAEERSQMALWSLMGAPLLVSADLRLMARDASDPHYAQSLAILKNSGMIAIDQDPLGAGGRLVLRDNPADDAGMDVVLKPLADGGLAFLILNKDDKTVTRTFPLSRLGVEAKPCSLDLIDIWTGKPERIEASGTLTVTLAAHDNAAWRIAPSACLTVKPRGQIAIAQYAFSKAPFCLDISKNGHIVTAACSAAPTQDWTLPDTNGQEGPVHNAAFPGECLNLDQRTGRVGLSACHTGVPSQTFRYHRDGMLTAAGECLDVGGGGIASPGERLMGAKCIPWRASQTFSAPHLGAPPV
ncbi:alpha-galactosidase [Acetobacter oeni]|uniref:Alpha-galactosidase n=1 Tax=Acetobacter oeni TaxID=304077 RepID=A0A511XQC1_9PROT|nr:alpha-galactosidase [Acetobacter oeni]